VLTVKKLISIVLAVLLLTALCGCGGEPAEIPTTVPAEPDYTASEADIAQLEKLYESRQPYQGELHDHADTGGTSDGKMKLDDWKMNLLVKDMDFATFADHRQVLHMRLPEWDNALFIGGTEACTWVNDSKARRTRS
jgi:hypothetical protein